MTTAKDASASDPASGAGVKFPPPLVYAIGLALGLALDRVLPILLGYRSSAGLLLVAAGLALDLWALTAFRRAHTTILPWGRASFLVPGGPYRVTRNPMYLGMATVYLGLAVALGSWWSLLLLPVVIFVITRFVIAREERHLEARFGADYDAYRARVRRWI